MNPETTVTATKQLDNLKYLPIYTLFQHAISHRLKYPRITLQASDGTVVILRVAGRKSRWPGQIQIVSEGQFGLDQLYFGRITESGKLLASGTINSHVHQLLDKLADDPLRVAFDYGKATGACCFCRLPLTDARSANHGFGPICAKNYGLSWNADRESNGFHLPAEVVAGGGLQ